MKMPTSSTPMLNLVLLGAPGTGKGTQSMQLNSLLGISHVATGNLYRQLLESKTELGIMANGFIRRGQLVPDDITLKMVQQRLSEPDLRNGFVLDGFPRTLPQAKGLTAILAESGRQLSGVLVLNISDKEMVDRLRERLVCRKCQAPFHRSHHPFQQCPFQMCHGQHLYQRNDDQPETIQIRLDTYYQQTAPLIAYYREANLLLEVNGEGSVQEVHHRILATIGIKSMDEKERDE